MNQLGIGAMLHQLSGGSEHRAPEFYGRKIVDATFSEEDVRLTFADGCRIRIYDDGQSCCESRYLTTDDDVRDLVGGALTEVVLREGPEQAGTYDEVHESQFMDIRTDKGFITVSSHNEHNGYYGGICMSIAVLAAQEERPDA